MRTLQNITRAMITINPSKQKLTAIVSQCHNRDHPIFSPHPDSTSCLCRVAKTMPSPRERMKLSDSAARHSYTSRIHTDSSVKEHFWFAGVNGQSVRTSSMGGLNVKGGVAGLRISVKYMFAILDPMSVVLAVLGVAGVNPFHCLACS
jgi:hypothetical protein